MKLHVTKSVGRGQTELGAFDAALVNAGVANFNVIRLSSVIPPGAEVIEVEGGECRTDGQWGDRLYAVYADNRTAIAGEQVWAGVGWSQDRETGRGLFVEHEGPTEQYVRDQICASIADLQANRGLTLGPSQMSVIGAMCAGTPVCALVICSYGTHPWDTTATDERLLAELALP